MGGIWRLQSDAVVRTPAVIEEDEALYMLQSLPVGLETPFLPVDALALDNAVYALRNTIVGRLVVFRHRYQYAMFLKFLHIEVAAVLNAAVRVVDESREVTTAGLFYGHAESLEREDGCQRV